MTSVDYLDSTSLSMRQKRRCRARTSVLRQALARKPATVSLVIVR